ncbi:hypothetical protein JCM8547_000286 [Rhodosporidiobolus lusitaniae]
MATLEQTRGDTTSKSPTAATSSTFLPSAVPTPFPEQERDSSRGRPSGVGQSSARLANDGNDQASSRSPGGTRRSLSRVVGNIKRAMSASRDSQAAHQDRGRRGSAETTGTEEPRGRSPLAAALSPRSLSRSRADSIPEDGVAHYPPSQQQTRSTSRGRSLHSTAGGKVFSTGRGGAGNMLGLGENQDPLDFTGEEDPNVVNQVRTDRSRSRERQGYPEVATSGRGGRGNIRSQSRTRDLELGRVPTVMEEQERFDKEDEELREIELARKKEREGPERWVSSGRGGAGNFFSPRRQSDGA